MLEAGRDGDFLKKTVPPDGRGEFGLEDLDCHVPTVFSVESPENRRHSTFTSLALYVIPVGEVGLQRFENIGRGHWEKMVPLEMNCEGFQPWTSQRHRTVIQ